MRSDEGRSMAVDYPNLEGRVAFVTGGRRGIGRAIARRLAARGARIVISVIHRGEERVDETIEMFAREKLPLEIVECDLTDVESRSTLVARAAEKFGPIDILVNNVSGNPRVPPDEMTLEQRRFTMELNLHAHVDMMQQALPHMRQQGWGRILNLLSESIRQPQIPYPAGERSVLDIVVYGAGKAALQRYTEGLAAEMHGTGVTVNGIFPYRVCVTQDNSAHARAALKLHPELAEGVEMMAEGAMVLMFSSLTGAAMSSRQAVYAFQQPLHTLDGRTVIGDAATIPDLD
jgi:NAD(P)-dependent dehydrogenase (short-subunit alcohol dehydrogenase family)